MKPLFTGPREFVARPGPVSLTTAAADQSISSAAEEIVNSSFSPARGARVWPTPITTGDGAPASGRPACPTPLGPQARAGKWLESIPSLVRRQSGGRHSTHQIKMDGHQHAPGDGPDCPKARERSGRADVAEPIRAAATRARAPARPEPQGWCGLSSAGRLNPPGRADQCPGATAAGAHWPSRFSILGNWKEELEQHDFERCFFHLALAQQSTARTLVLEMMTPQQPLP